MLDFGLAKVLEDEPAKSSLGNSPTLTLGHTRAGMILGTAAYMSPEQAIGRPVDRRSDIFSFGAVLFEMLTGKRAFQGETTPDVLEAVVKKDPDWPTLPAGTPGYLRKLLERMLAKDRRERLQAIGEARISLESPGQGEQRIATAPSRSRLSLGLAVTAALFALVLAALAFVHFREPKEESRTIKLLVPPPENATAIGLVTVSPDGRRVAFVATIPGKNSIWVRDVDSLTARPLAGTEGGNPLAWSPDSRFLAFSTAAPDRKLKKIDLTSGSVLTIFDARDSIIREASWGKGVIVFLQQTSIGLGIGLMRIPDTGGTPTQVTAINTAAGEGGHFSPWFLPDGRHFLYTADNRDRGKGAVYVADADSKDAAQNGRMVVAAGSNAEFAPLGSGGQGYLLFVRDRTLMAQPFDADAARTTGDVVPVGEQVNPIGDSPKFDFSVSQNPQPYGVLAYASGRVTAPSDIELVWLDRSGKRVGEALGQTRTAAPYAAISPDGKTVAYDRRDPQTGFDDIWLHDVVSGGESKFTFNSRNNDLPIWSPNGDYIAYYSDRDGVSHVYRKATSGVGPEEAVDKDEYETFLNDWSEDGRYLIEAKTVLKPTFHREVWVLPLAPPDKTGEKSGDTKRSPVLPQKAFPYLRGEFNQRFAKLSPDGKWLAYQSEETKRNEIWVQTFPTPGGKWQISTNGGEFPVWSKDGKELYFLGAGRKMMAVEVKAGSVRGSPFGVPQALFDAPLLSPFDVSKDRRFLLPSRIRSQEQPAPVAPINVLVNWAMNWAEGLKK